MNDHLDDVAGLFDIGNEDRPKKKQLFKLDEDFIASFVKKQPNWGPVGYVTYKRTYARPLESNFERYQELAKKYKLKGNEEWWLTITRVVEGTFRIQQLHCENLRLDWGHKKAQKMAQEMFEQLWNFKWLPPGRGLWAMGTPIVSKVGGASLCNCAFSSTKNINISFSEPFCFLMDMSMLGVGVGGDCKGAGKVTIRKPKIDGEFIVQDTRESWVNLVRVVLESYVGNDQLPSSVNYSNVRKRGEPIRTFGGTAAGPEPLMELYNNLTTLLDKRIGNKITSADIVDIFNMIGRCVVAGNVRRSAEIMFGEMQDEEFISLKDYQKNPYRADWGWASNNSIFANIGMDYSLAAQMTADNGEPGYEWLDNARKYSRMGRDPDYSDMLVEGANPCVEQSLEPFELCCLVETFPVLNNDADDFGDTLKMAYMYAKTVTLVPTHNTISNAVMLRNRRIGTSVSGIVQAMKKFGRRRFLQMCDVAYSDLCSLDEEYSKWLCIPKSIKKTSVKPSGTVSLLPGVTPGIHFPKGEYYYRVIRFDSESNLVEKYNKAGYKCVNLEPKEPNTVAVYFPVKENYFDRTEDQVSMWEQLELAAQIQQYWADNQVSVTIGFDKHEAKDIKYALELYETRLKSVSFLPKVDHKYEHAPIQPISQNEYENYVASLKKVDLSDAENELMDKFCDGATCEIKLK